MPGPCSCSGSLCLALRRDISRYVYSICGSRRPGTRAIFRVTTSPGLWAVIVYRLTHHLLYRFPLPAIGNILAISAIVASRPAAILFGIEMEPRAHIGRGLLVDNFGGIVIGAVTMGSNCTISQGATLGRSSMVQGDALNDLPTLGDRVYIGPRAIVAGPITVSDDVSVAGGSLVTRDIPARGIAMGVPAKVVSRNGSFRQVRYRNMENDPLRLAALATLADAQGTEPTASI